MLRRDSTPEWPESDVFVFCHVCRASLPAVCEAVGVAMWRVKSNNEQLDRLIGNCRQEPASLPSPAAIARWQDNLRRSGWNSYVTDVRGLSPDVISKYRIGHDHLRFTLPVYGPSGRLVNLRTYSPDTHPKMLGLRGRGIQLYPTHPYNDERHPFVVLCEGEWDALVCRRNGILAVTSTGGVGGWNPEWSDLFADLNVAVIFDCDADAQEEALRRGKGLGSAGAAAVKAVDLGLGHKEDLTNWFVTYGRTAGDLRTLIRSSPKVAS